MESTAHMAAASTVTKGTGSEDTEMLHLAKIVNCPRSNSRSSGREQTWDRDRDTRNFKKKGSRSTGKKARHPEQEKTHGKDSRGT